MPAPRRHAATSVGALRRRRSTELCPRVSRAGSPGGTAPSVPCRATSRRSSAAISSAASSASDSPVPSARATARGLSWRSPARVGASVRRATVGTWLETAAHLADHVIPPVPVRQWVISVPKRLPGFLADRRRAVAALTKIFLDEIERSLLTTSGVTAAADTPSAPRPRLGAQPPCASAGLE